MSRGNFHIFLRKEIIIMDITERIRELCERDNISIRKLERELGIGNSTIRRWSKQIPSADTLQKAAQYFGVTVGYLLGDSDDPEVEYYIDPEVAQLAQDLKDRPELRVLFDASRKMSKETIEALIKFIDNNK